MSGYLKSPIGADSDFLESASYSGSNIAARPDAMEMFPNSTLNVTTVSTTVSYSTETLLLI